MKINCEIVMDLLPLYEEGLCSESSRTAVEEHLKECPNCRAMSKAVGSFPEPETTEIPEGDEAIAKSFRKVRRRWWLSLIAAMLVVPMVWLCVNQYRGQGLCFTNVDEALKARRYAAALVEGDWEEAAELMDYGHLYDEVQEVLDWQPEDYVTGYRKLTVGEQVFYVTVDTWYYHGYEDYFYEPEEFWVDAVMDSFAGGMIPEKWWEYVKTVEPEAIVEYENGAIEVNNRKWYYRLETDWGVFYADDDGLRECVTAEEFTTRLNIVPEDIFLEGCDGLTEEVMGMYESNQDYYAEAKYMTEAEFTDYVKTAYISDLEKLEENGYSFQLAGFEDAYYAEENGGWTIIYGLNLIHEGQVRRLSLHILVRPGGLSIGAMGYADVPGEELDVAEILFMSYPKE